MDKVSILHHLDLEDGKFAETTPAELSAIFDEIKKTKAKKIVLHFHGGLVNRESGHASARVLLPDYQKAGAYPIFTIWNTRETALTKNLDEIGQEQIFRQLVRRIGQVLLGKMMETVTGGLIGARGKGDESLVLDPITDFPSDLEELEAYLSQKEREIGVEGQNIDQLSEVQDSQVQQVLESDKRIQRETQKIANQIKKERGIDPPGGTKSVGTIETTSTLMSKAVLDEVEAELTTDDPQEKALPLWITLARYGWKISRAVIKRFKKGTDHTLYTTIVEEVLRTLYVDSLGGLAWTLIKKDTADAFDQDEPNAGARALLVHLVDYWKDNPDLEVYLVGHSAGSIYVGEYIREADNLLPPEAKFSVILLAAAATFSFYHDMITTIGGRVKNVRNFALTDEQERGYWEVPGVYNASLLYLVSGCFEADEIDMPITGMARYYGEGDRFETPVIKKIREFLMDDIHVWAPTDSDAPPGRRSQAQRHGAFQTDKETRESLVHIIQGGFA